MTHMVDSAAVGAFTGKHTMAELSGVDAPLLDDEQLLRAVLTSALVDAGATVLDVTSKRFDPQGVTVLALLSESHASVHTYPEIGRAFLDVFTCGHRADPERAVRHIATALHTSALTLTTIDRGLL